MPELPDIEAYLGALRTRVDRPATDQDPHRQPVPAAHCRPTALQRRGPRGSRAAARRQAHRLRLRQRSLAGAAPDDRRPAALASAGREARRPAESGGLRLSRRLAGAHRGGQQAPCVSATLRAAKKRWRSVDPGGIDVFASRPRCVSRGAHLGEPHAQARAHRSAVSQRHRQCVFGRDSARAQSCRRSRSRTS